MKYMTVREYEKNLILEDLARTKQALDNAYDHFENVVDPDLIDCYIYEVNAVQQKYKYLYSLQALHLQQRDSEEHLHVIE